MCEFDWALLAEMLGGVGTFLAGVAALFVLPFQLDFRKKAKKSKEEVEQLQMSLKLMLPLYEKFMASEEGIVWGDYPKDAEKIINGISRRTKLDKDLVRKILDELKTDGKI